MYYCCCVISDMRKEVSSWFIVEFEKLEFQQELNMGKVASKSLIQEFCVWDLGW